MDYKELRRNTVFTGKVFNVEQVTIRLPNSREARFDLVRHPEAVTIIPLDAERRILFVRQFRLGAEGMLLELPAGVLNSGEDPTECARREIREETGMAARNMKKLGEFFLAPGYSSELMHVFLATDLTPNPLLADEDEFIQVEAIPVREALRMARRGEIMDSKSLSGLLLAQTYLEADLSAAPSAGAGNE